jgi:hypothetical protein
VGIGDQPGGEQDGEIGGSGGQPALAEPVVEAGGGFDGGGGGEEDEVKGRTSWVAISRPAAVPSPARVVMVATMSRSLRQETARPKTVKRSRMAPAVQVEMA